MESVSHGKFQSGASHVDHSRPLGKVDGSQVTVMWVMFHGTVVVAVAITTSL